LPLPEPMPGSPNRLRTHNSACFLSSRHAELSNGNLPVAFLNIAHTLASIRLKVGLRCVISISLPLSFITFAKSASSYLLLSATSSSVTPARSLISCDVVLISCCFNPPGLDLTSGNPVVSLTAPLDASCLVGLGDGTLVGLVAPSALVGLTCSSAE